LEFFGMHNCSETKERLIEMVLDGVDCAAELDGCAECRTEFAALNATLRMTRRISETTPDESYWSSYHTRLRQKLATPVVSSHAEAQRCEQDAEKNRASALRLFFAPLRLCVRTTIRVPVPLAVVIVVACVALTAFALRRSEQPAAPPPLIVHVPVTVPVVQEKVVTRVVYRDSRAPGKTSRHITTDARAESTFALTGFKPTEEIKLTVIKGGVPNEK